MASKHYGHGRWPRKQLYAIVAHYWAMGRDVEWVSGKLGVGVKMVAYIYDYFDERCQHELDDAREAAGGDPLDQLLHL